MEASYQCKSCQAIHSGAFLDKCSCGGPLTILSYDISEVKLKLGECYEEICNILDIYMDMPKEHIKFIAVWIIGTYFHKTFSTYPYLFFNAIRGGGKTRLLKLISALGAKGDGSVQNNLTEAVLFRIPQGTTTCIDEVEQIGSKEKQTLRELLNSAYKRGMKVKRMKKVKKNNEENQVVEVFEPYFPIAMANIWGVEEVLGDRSIVLVLEKSNDPGKTKLVEDFETNVTILALKRTLNAISDVSDVTLREKNYIERWNHYINDKYNVTTTLTSLTTQTTLTTPEQDNLEILELFNKIDNLGISGRNFELLLPLLLTANHIGFSVFEDILTIGSKIVAQKKEDEYSNSIDVQVYEFVDSKNDIGLNYIHSKDLIIEFRTFLGDSDDQDRWLNEKWFGKALKRLNLILEKKKVNNGKKYLLDFAKAKEKLKMFKSEVKDE